MFDLPHKNQRHTKTRMFHFWEQTEQFELALQFKQFVPQPWNKNITMKAWFDGWKVHQYTNSLLDMSLKDIHGHKHQPTTHTEMRMSYKRMSSSKPCSSLDTHNNTKHFEKTALTRRTYARNTRDKWTARSIQHRRVEKRAIIRVKCWWT